MRHEETIWFSPESLLSPDYKEDIPADWPKSNGDSTTCVLELKKDSLGEFALAMGRRLIYVILTEHLVVVSFNHDECYFHQHQQGPTQVNIYNWRLKCIGVSLPYKWILLHRFFCSFPRDRNIFKREINIPIWRCRREGSNQCCERHAFVNSIECFLS